VTTSAAELANDDGHAPRSDRTHTYTYKHTHTYTHTHTHTHRHTSSVRWNSGYRKRVQLLIYIYTVKCYGSGEFFFVPPPRTVFFESFQYSRPLVPRRNISVLGGVTQYYTVIVGEKKTSVALFTKTYKIIHLLLYYILV